MDNLEKESLKQKAAAWDLITDLLDKLEPDWLANNKTGQQSALDAISKLASERDSLRAELQRAREQDPVGFVFLDEGAKGCKLKAGIDILGEIKVKPGDKLYAAPVPAMQYQHDVAHDQLITLIERVRKWGIENTGCEPSVSCFHQAVDELRMHLENPTEKDDEFRSKFFSAIDQVKSPRITEQDAREILEHFVSQYNMIGRDPYIKGWMQHHCRALLNKLNANAVAEVRQYPVGYCAKIAAYWEFFDDKEYADQQYKKLKDAHELVDNCRARNDHWSPPEPVFSHPSPAQAAAIPERLALGSVCNSDYVKGWNDCVDTALSEAPKPNEKSPG